jgi:nucleoside 2-deoxyribosyltransferase
MTIHGVFFGYPSRPEVRRETLALAAQGLGQLPQLDVRTWEQLRTTGRVVIDTIYRAIDEADVTAFDISSLNPNVLFELGYAVGREKTIWLTFDDTDQAARDSWKQFRTLTPMHTRSTPTPPTSRSRTSRTFPTNEAVACSPS